MHAMQNHRQQPREHQQSRRGADVMQPTARRRGRRDVHMRRFGEVGGHNQLNGEKPEMSR